MIPVSREPDSFGFFRGLMWALAIIVAGVILMALVIWRI